MLPPPTYLATLDSGALHSLHRPFLVFPHECEACKIAVRRQTAITFAVRLPSATLACTRDACIVQASYSAVRPTRSAGAGGHVIRSLLGTSGPAVTLGELRYGAPCNRQGSARPTDRAGRPWRGASTAHSSSQTKQPVPPFSPGGGARGGSARHAATPRRRAALGPMPYGNYTNSTATAPPAGAKGPACSGCCASASHQPDKKHCKSSQHYRREGDGVLRLLELLPRLSLVGRRCRSIQSTSCIRKCSLRRASSTSCARTSRRPLAGI